jgi:hypothetical protein
MLQSTTEAGFTQIEDTESQLLIRYKIDPDRFRQVISSVTSRSVVFLGVAQNDLEVRPGDTFKCVLIGLVSLPAPVEPAKTVASLEGDYLVLHLAKIRELCLRELCSRSST